jgi:hypothetical protein
VEGLPEFDELDLSGDWIVRQRSDVAARLAPVERELSVILGREIVFERRRETRDVLVARGRFTFRPLDPPVVLERHSRRNDWVEIYDGTPRLERAVGSIGGVTDLLADLGDARGVRVVSEVPVHPQPVMWRNHAVLAYGAADRDRVDSILETVAEQTGVAFAWDKREVEVWVAKE